MSNVRDILHLFERPTEPIFMLKGNNDIFFNVPSNYVLEPYRQNIQALTNRFGSKNARTVRIKEISIPDISLPMRLGRRELFSLFVPSHREMASRLIEVFMGMVSFDDFMSVSAYCRDRINPYLFVYCLSVAMIHRPETKNLPLPSPCDCFPERYIDGRVFARAKEEASIVCEGSRTSIEIPVNYTATDLDIEHRLAYWREDLGLNNHHWHWHLVYPFEGPRNIVDKDRRGELFFYHHQQIMARYNMERFSNNLARTERFNDFRQPMSEGYFPKLETLVASRVWAPRFANTTMKDVNRELKISISDMERWRENILDAIHSGQIVTDDGRTVVLSEDVGIDILGNIVEASILTPNRRLYGDLHNAGHLAIGVCHDPDFRHLEPFGTIGDPSTSMRDPMFYKWHAMIDYIFQEYKDTLPSYTVNQLDYPGIRALSVEVNTLKSGVKNQISTFWQQSDVDMSQGLDFQPQGSVRARFTHLQHGPFQYKFTLENTGRHRTGTVRIFYAPKLDERGRTMFFRDQKILFVELDKFELDLKPGTETYYRDSTQSSVTIPFDRTFRDIDAKGQAPGRGQSEEFNFCGCGWPQHLLIAKGQPQGFPCELFLMVSDPKQDRVAGAVEKRACSEAASYCGVRDSKYPDKRSMGFPFDRQPRQGVTSLSEFMTPNMTAADVTIKFSNRVVLRNGLKPLTKAN
ncbi:phenoloxidase 2 [Cimex lectularius]|uniref:Tyrosinase copper-binding domain-containing protein n=1 Tax=Cimex lectularius TaxID=79782 RepID=A0A8I6THU3_CIMLE|nr:phenoloxidase 2 [Cimex lectularius]